jgi:hypothetical protein
MIGDGTVSIPTAILKIMDVALESKGEISYLY